MNWKFDPARVARLSMGFGLLSLSACAPPTPPPAQAAAPPPPAPPAANVLKNAEETAYWEGFAAGRRDQARKDGQILANLAARAAQPQAPPPKPAPAPPPPVVAATPTQNAYNPAGPATPLPDAANEQ